MPRLTPWPDSAPVDPLPASVLIEEVLRPNLQRAYPLPDRNAGREDRFRGLLSALARADERSRDAGRS